MKDDKSYVQDNKGIVYKVMPTHYLQLSPWKDGDDRRIYELDNDEFQILTYDNACMIVNKQFADTKEEWEFNGKKYLANPIVDASTNYAILKLLPSHKIKKRAENILKEIDNNTLSFQNEDGTAELKLVRHKGKILYILLLNDPTITRARAYDLFGKFIQWVGIKDCKPIFCSTDKRYI